MDTKRNDPVHLKLGSQEFDQIYLEYFNDLHRYAYTIVKDEIIAEEIVHEMFWRVLEKPEGIKVHTSLKAFLYRAVYFECLNYLKQQQVKNKYELHTMNSKEDQTDTAASSLQLKELEKRLQDAINYLPEQCRTIFQLSRFEELKYSQIASSLGLSVKTVETQMSRALKKLRVQLADYLPVIMWFFYSQL